MKKFSGSRLNLILGIATILAVSTAYIPNTIAQVLPAQWTTNGPYGGEIKDIAISPDYTTDQTIFAATDFSGNSATSSVAPTFALP